VIAVIGSAGEIAADLEDDARALGAAIVNRGFRLVSGGLDGVMAAASRGAREARGWADGRIIGVLPSYDRRTANPWCDVVIPTGAQLMRNTIVVAMADAVIAVAGGAGTLSEIALAWQLGRPIVALDAHQGWSARLADRALDERHTGHVIRAAGPVEAVDRAAALIGEGSPEAGDIGSGWRSRS
jgi:hypothetical protein